MLYQSDKKLSRVATMGNFVGIILFCFSIELLKSKMSKA